MASAKPSRAYAGEVERSRSDAFRDACSRSSRARACCRGAEEDPLLPNGGDSGVRFPIEDIGRGGVFARG